MKYLIILTCSLNFLLNQVTAQSTRGLEPQALTSYRLYVTNNKTTSVVFPASIVDWDAGSVGIIVQPFNKVPNTMRVKANQANFTETSLTIFTADERMYTFVVNYAEAPPYLSINLNNEKEKTKSQIGKIIDASPNAESLLATTEKVSIGTPISDEKKEEKIAVIRMPEDSETLVLLKEEVRKQRRRIKHLGITEHDIKLTCQGIYSHDKVMLLHFKAKNRSRVPYDVDFIKLRVVDKSVVRRTISQRQEIHPIEDDPWTHPVIIPAKGSTDLVYAIERLTIPDEKLLIVELYEKKGGRNMSFRITNQDLLNARSL